MAALLGGVLQTALIVGVAFPLTGGQYFLVLAREGLERLLLGFGPRPWRRDGGLFVRLIGRSGIVGGPVVAIGSGVCPIRGRSVIG